MTITPSRIKFYTNSLNSFLSSSSKFRILRSFSPLTPAPSTPPTPKNLTSLGLNSLDGHYTSKSYYPSTEADGDSDAILQSLPQTLYILDSSFNPPTLAHAHICLSALRDHYASSELGNTKARLLLLLSTQNADKQITGATLEERLVGMESFATDLLTSWIYPGSNYYYTKRYKSLDSSAKSKSKSISDTEFIFGDEEFSSSYFESESESDALSTTSSPPNRSNTDPSRSAPEIEIALTSLPYFHDKSAAIESSAIYPPGTTHIHCTGFDTLIRVLNPKYYRPTHDLSPLIPFLERHKLRVTYRNTDDESCTKADQDTYLSSMMSQLPLLGGLSSWLTDKRIYMVPGKVGKDGREISSTKTRNLIRNLSTTPPHKKGAGSSKHKGKGNGKEKLVKDNLKGWVGDGVRKWILGERLYFEGREGAQSWKKGRLVNQDEVGLEFHGKEG